MGLDYQHSWAPDSRRLVFRADRDGWPGLMVADITTGEAVQITKTRLSSFAALALSAGAEQALERLSRSPGGVMYFHEREILRSRAERAARRRPIGEPGAGAGRGVLSRRQRGCLWR